MFGKKRRMRKELEAKRLEEKRTELAKKEEPKVALVEKEYHPPKKPKDRKMSYHITPHPSGGWQIKKGKAERALKRFKTQKEAITYAKELEKKGGSYIIHKADGSTRKKTY